MDTPDMSELEEEFESALDEYMHEWEASLRDRFMDESDEQE